MAKHELTMYNQIHNMRVKGLSWLNIADKLNKSYYQVHNSYCNAKRKGWIATNPKDEMARPKVIK